MNNPLKKSKVLSEYRRFALQDKKRIDSQRDKYIRFFELSEMEFVEENLRASRLPSNTPYFFAAYYVSERIQFVVSVARKFDGYTVRVFFDGTEHGRFVDPDRRWKRMEFPELDKKVFAESLDRLDQVIDKCLEIESSGYKNL